MNSETANLSFSHKISVMIAKLFDKSLYRNPTDFVIDIRDYTQKFRKFTAVNSINLKVTRGAIHGFIGPNGSGKTTTIKTIIGAIMPTNGKLYVNGYESGTVEAKKSIGYIPENARFPKRISTYDYLVSMGQLSGLKNSDSRTKAKEILEGLNLWKFHKKNPNSFSSGMKKKVLLAQSLLNNPDLLILDEPAANLDPTARFELFNDLKALSKAGKTIFISSHILSELQTLVDEVTILNFGQIVYSGNISSDTKTQVLLRTSNDDEVIKILKINKYKVEKQEKDILIHYENEKQLLAVLKLLYDKNIILYEWKQNIANLENLYQKIVMESNKNFGNASAIKKVGK